MLLGAGNIAVWGKKVPTQRIYNTYYYLYDNKNAICIFFFVPGVIKSKMAIIINLYQEKKSNFKSRGNILCKGKEFHLLNTNSRDLIKF